MSHASIQPGDRAIPPTRALVPLDPGWLFLLAGATLCAVTALIPAFDQLAEAELARDRARVAERFHLSRLQNYASYRDALWRADPGLTLSLASQQLNLVPEGRDILPVPGETAPENLSPFPALEPDAPPTLYRVVPDTVLQRWTTDDRKRLWLLAAGAFCILLGLLPPTIQRPRLT